MHQHQTLTIYYLNGWTQQSKQIVAVTKINVHTEHQQFPEIAEDISKSDTNDLKHAKCHRFREWTQIWTSGASTVKFQASQLPSWPESKARTVCMNTVIE